MLAVGLYEVSRRLEQGERPDFRVALVAYRRNLRGVVAMGLVLVLAMAAWTEVALLIFMLFFHDRSLPLDGLVYGLLTSPDVVTFLFIGSAAGFPIACLVFAISAVSIPMLLDRDVPLATAVATSIAAVRQNYRVMAGWAATIVLLVGIGFATMFIGLAVILPWLAYATWHSYRALVN